jgi:hypothetical protein
VLKNLNSSTDFFDAKKYNSSHPLPTPLTTLTLARAPIECQIAVAPTKMMWGRGVSGALKQAAAAHASGARYAIHTGATAGAATSATAAGSTRAQSLLLHVRPRGQHGSFAAARRSFHSSIAAAASAAAAAAAKSATGVRNFAIIAHVDHGGGRLYKHKLESK